MKVLQVINSLGTGGAEKLLLDSIPLYRQQGIVMDILLLWDNNLPFVKLLEKENCCKIFILKKSKSFKDIYSLSHIRKIRKIIKEYDIIHVHLFPAQYFVAIANLGLGKTLIFTEHNTTNRRVEHSILKLLDRYVYSAYDKVVVISDDVRLKFEKHIGSEKMVTIYNGVDVRKIQKTLAGQKTMLVKGVTENDIVLLQVSSFRSQKDHPTLIKALQRLPTNYKLLLAGDGELRADIEKLSRDLGVINRVHFLGNRNDIPNLVKTVDINILSSNYEGLSLSSIEGLASGKPFIASDVPGLREIVRGAGLLFPKGDAKALADLIQQLIKNSEYSKKISHSGITKALQFDIHIMINNYIDLYQILYFQSSGKPKL